MYQTLSLHYADNILNVWIIYIYIYKNLIHTKEKYAGINYNSLSIYY